MNSNELPEVVVLTRGWKITKADYLMLLQQARAKAERLPRGAKCVAEDLIDAELWEGTGRGTHSLIGRCIAHMVKHRRLPLEFVGCYLCTNKQYVRI